jgi:hypothetical protein
MESSVSDIQWASKDIVFVLSFDGKVYRSRNGGRSWEDQHANMRSTGHKIREIKISPVNQRHIFFLGSHGHHVATTDLGESYYPVSFPLTDIRMHPRDANVLLSAVMTPACGRAAHPADEHLPPALRDRARTDCFKQLFLSRDLGKSWTHLYDYVMHYDWLPQPQHAHGHVSLTVLATVHAEQTGNQPFGRWNVDVNLVVSKDLFQSEPELLVPHGNVFLFGGSGFVFVIGLDPEDQGSLRMQVAKSLDGLSPESFKQAMLPVSLREHSYTILDASEDSVFLHVNHQPFSEQAYAGHIYVSDSTGTQFSLSLPFNHRNALGKCDFASLEGIEGIFLANLVDELEMAEQQHHSPDTHVEGHDSHAQTPLRVKTVISFNKGAQWTHLAAPDTDADGNPYRCKHEGTCQLHLHGKTHGYGPFYSVASARGLVMATGVVGPYLQSVPGLINTYFSEDGGLTWREVAKGSHIYELGDHGGLIVMASDQHPTDTLYYSWDHARTWTAFRFTSEPILVENIITEPSSSDPHFIVYGAATGAQHAGAGVLVYVDFARLHPRACTGIDAPGVDASDYELWSPHDGRTGGKCLMGHTLTYVRRKAAAQCQNPSSEPKPSFVSHCACTLRDFECDVGYMRDGPEEPCVPDASADAMLRAHAEDRCTGQASYRVSKGYRRVPGNTCVGGAEWTGLVVPCPSGWLAPSSSSTSILLVAVLLLLVGLCVAKTEAFDTYLASLRSRFKSTQGYMQVGVDDTHPHSAQHMQTNVFDDDVLGTVDESDDQDQRASILLNGDINKSKNVKAATFSAPPALQPPPDEQ